ncbi:MAG: DUF2800 domain-containing protein [Candidatus Methylacidiphilales bacterium]
MGEHAILSPSGASRWLECTPSARLEQQFPDRSGTAAAEGTLAHAIGELFLKKSLGLVKKAVYEKQIKILSDNPLFEQVMFEYMENYETYVLEQFENAKSHTKDAIIFLEQKLNLTDYVPDGFGTGDVVIIADGVMDIIDLKYGKGVPVSAVDNKQMMLYSLGALREFDYMYKIDKVRMTIYQPRLDSISIFEMDVKELKEWAENELKPKAALAFKGEGEFKAGEACRFCKAKAVCKANADYNLELAKYDFKESPLLSDEDISDIMNRTDTFIKWLNAVNENALYEAVNNGKRWPGYKLVEGRSNRVYVDETKVAETLKVKGYADDFLYIKKLLGITAMEKALGKNEFTETLSDLVVKPAGKPTLVLLEDKRPEYNSAEGAAQDFEFILNEDLL